MPAADRSMILSPQLLFLDPPKEAGAAVAPVDSPSLAAGNSAPPQSGGNTSTTGKTQTPVRTVSNATPGNLMIITSTTLRNPTVQSWPGVPEKRMNELNAPTTVLYCSPSSCHRLDRPQPVQSAANHRAAQNRAARMINRVPDEHCESSMQTLFLQNLRDPDQAGQRHLLQHTASERQRPLLTPSVLNRNPSRVSAVSMYCLESH